MFSIATTFLVSCIMSSSLSSIDPAFEYSHSSYFQVGLDSVEVRHFESEDGYSYPQLRGMKNARAERTINNNFRSTIIPLYADFLAHDYEADEQERLVAVEYDEPYFPYIPQQTTYEIDYITADVVSASYRLTSDHGEYYGSSDCGNVSRELFDATTGEEVHVLDYFFEDQKPARQYMITVYEMGLVQHGAEEDNYSSGSMTPSYDFHFVAEGIQLIRTETTFYTCDSPLDCEEFEMVLPFSEFKNGDDIKLIKQP